MKYPIFSNWIIYKKIPDDDAYVVKDCVLKNKFVVSGEKMRFAKKLNGKTNPYSIKGKRSREEIRNLIEELDRLGVIRTDRGVISRGMNGYIRTLVRTRNTRGKRIASELLNFLLMLLFVPVLIGGIYVYLNADYVRYSDLSVIEQILHRYSSIFIWVFNILAVICGGAIHELCHGIACRAYGGRVFEYGFMLEVLPGFYTLMDDSGVKSRLKKVQILAAGVEGNILFAGCLLLLTGFFPGIQSFLFVAAVTNIVMTIVNMMAMRSTDGYKILMLLIGMDETDDLEKAKNTLKKRNRRQMLVEDGLYGYAKLTACYMIVWLQRVFPMLILLEVIAWIGAFL